MGLDTKTYWLTDRQSQCDFDFNLTWVYLVVRQSPASKEVNTEVEGSTVLEAVTRQ
jgi:hypothetical protein